MINKVVLVGRITADPELRKTSGGLSVVTFTLALNRRFDREKTDFIRCTAWRQSADFMAQYVHKGDVVGVDGSLQTGRYEDKDTGKTINTMDVVCDQVQIISSFTGSRQSSENNSRPGQPAVQSEPEFKNYDEGESLLDIASDDLPF